MLVVPPADPTLTPPQALGNTYAALTELNHYSRPDTTFSAHYDDRNGFVREKDPPFTRCYLVPGIAAALNLMGGSGVQGTPRARTPTPVSVPTSRPRPSHSGERITKPGSRLVTLATLRGTDASATEAMLKPYSDAADLIRLNLLTPMGRCIDEVRPADECPAPGVTLAAFGLTAFGWPRTEVVARTAATVARRVLKRWAAPDPMRARQVMPAIAQANWSQLGLDPETILGPLQRAADLATGDKIEEQIRLAADPLLPRGWLARLPEPEKVVLALDRLVQLLGPPASPAKRQLTVVEQALADAAAQTRKTFIRDIHTLVPTLVDDPQFRFSGAEELLRQFLATTDRLRDLFAQSAADLDAKAQSGFECVSQYGHFQKGMRKPAAAEFTEAIRQYPRARFQALTYRNLLAIYHAVREALMAELNAVASARQRLAAATFPEPAVEAIEMLPVARRLMPPGCPSVAEAAERFLAVITDADLAEIDRRVQEVIEPDRGGMLQACLDSAIGPDGVVTTVYEEARAHLEIRLGEVDLAAMFAERHHTSQQVERVIEQTYQEAEPAWVGSGPWAASEVAVLGCPAGAGGEPLRELARRAIPVAGLPIAELRDDLVFYREWPAIPLAALPHLGPAAAEAYLSLPETQQCTAHARLDVTIWKNIDAP